MRRIVLFSLLMSTLGLMACNTIEGLGKDIKAGGSAIERKAEEHK